MKDINEIPVRVIQNCCGHFEGTADVDENGEDNRILMTHIVDDDNRPLCGLLPVGIEEPAAMYFGEVIGVAQVDDGFPLCRNCKRVAESRFRKGWKPNGGELAA